jgi:tetratricopeptide (TPR) repeat protein
MRPFEPDIRTSRSRRRPERRCAALLVAAAVLAPAAGQPEAIARALDAIAAERARAVDPSRTAAERLEDAERLLDRRAALLADHPDDMRRGEWLADQASDLLFVLLPIENSGLTSLFGLPSAEQAARARRVAEQVSSLTVEAEQAIQQAIIALESAPGYVHDVGAQRARRELADVQRDRRIPFLQGVGACLQAELADARRDDRAALYRLASRRLRPLSEMLTGRTADLTRVYLGLALHGLGDDQTAGSLLSAVADDEAAGREEAIAATMALVRLSFDRDGLDAASGRLDAAMRRLHAGDRGFERLLLADQWFVLHRAAANRAAEGSRTDLLVRAFGPYLDLLAPGGSPALSAAVLEHLARAAGDDTPLAKLPAVVTAARAHRLAGDDRTRAEAVDLYAQVIERPDAGAVAQIEAMWGLGRALIAEDRLAEAERVLDRLAREYPGDRHAEAAIELAATIATELWRRAPDDPDARARLRSTLDLLLDRYPNLDSIDGRRRTAAMLAAEEGRYERAAELLGQIPPDADCWLDAQVQRVAVLRSWAMAESDPAARVSRWQRVRDAAGVAQRAVRSAVAAARDPDAAARRRDDLASLAVYAAQARLGLGDAAGALEALESVGDDTAAAAEAALIRIDAYTALGATDAIDRELDRLLAVAGPRAGDMLGTLLETRRRALAAGRGGSVSSDVARAAQRRLLPVARALAGWLQTARDGPGLARLALDAADAFLLAEQWNEALALYERAADRRPQALEPLVGRAECLFNLGGDHLAEAMQIYKRVAAATSGRMDDAYWQAQLRMLQILSLTGHNTQQIAPHVQQLRKKDAELGGERFRREFERLQARYQN